MSEMTCKHIRKKLVSYADGDLSPTETEAVRRHLQQCDGCREVLTALERSIGLAEAIWEDGIASLQAVSAPVSPKGRGIRWSRVGLAAAAALLLAACSIVLWRVRSRPGPAGPHAREVRTLAQIERDVSRAGVSAQLFAAAEMLAKEPEAHAIASERFYSIVNEYPDTPAARRARERLAPLNP